MSFEETSSSSVTSARAPTYSWNWGIIQRHVQTVNKRYKSFRIRIEVKWVSLSISWIFRGFLSLTEDQNLRNKINTVYLSFFVFLFFSFWYDLHDSRKRKKKCKCCFNMLVVEWIYNITKFLLHVLDVAPWHKWIVIHMTEKETFAFYSLLICFKIKFIDYSKEGSFGRNKLK